MNAITPIAAASLPSLVRSAAQKLAESDRALRDAATDCRRAKALWVSTARKSFVASDRKPCLVCGKFESLAHAHHVTPLAMQHDHGLAQPDHAHVWLCPSHHAAVHLIISQMAGKRIKASQGIVSLLNEMGDDGHARTVLNLATEAFTARLAHADALEAWAQSRRAAA